MRLAASCLSFSLDCGLQEGRGFVLFISCCFVRLKHSLCITRCSISICSLIKTWNLGHSLGFIWEEEEKSKGLIVIAAVTLSQLPVVFSLHDPELSGPRNFVPSFDDSAGLSDWPPLHPWATLGNHGGRAMQQSRPELLVLTPPSVLTSLMISGQVPSPLWASLIYVAHKMGLMAACC